MSLFGIIESGFMVFEMIIVEVEDYVVFIKLNCFDVLNVLNNELLMELCQVLVEVD